MMCRYHALQAKCFINDVQISRKSRCKKFTRSFFFNLSDAQSLLQSHDDSTHYLDDQWNLLAEELDSVICPYCVKCIMYCLVAANTKFKLALEFFISSSATPVTRPMLMKILVQIVIFIEWVFYVITIKRFSCTSLLSSEDTLSSDQQRHRLCSFQF